MDPKSAAWVMKPKKFISQYPNIRIKAFIKRFHGRVMAYRDLPAPAQLAMAWYMAVDGEAWTLPEAAAYWSMQGLQDNFRTLLPYFLKKYGRERYGYMTVPMKEMVAEISRDPDWVGKSSIDSFAMPPRPHSKRNRWPVILNSDDSTIMQDGWHRFADYYRQGAKIVPVVYYPLR